MQDKTDVVVTDIQMPFGSMVVFMVKWTIASIPAMIIVFVVVAVTAAILGSIFGGLLGLG
jgi:hypothetical protein